MHAHARRTSESSLALPSSPPVAAQHPGDAHDPSEERSVVSPAQTLWTALSPTLTLANSSPELPTLPTLSQLGRIPRTPSTVARNDRPAADDTSFYTASWGSPYRHPPPVFNPQRQASTNFGSDDFEEASSALQFGLGHLLPPRLEVEDDAPGRFNLEHLIPRVDPDGSPNQFTLENLIQSRLPRSVTPTRESQASGFTPRASDKNPTSEEWVRSFLEERWNREKNKWKSDISFDIDSDTESDQDQQFLLPGPPKRGHKPRNNNKTLNQQDFWRHISADQKEALGKMMASKYADAESTSYPRETLGSAPAAPQFPPRTSSARNLFASPLSPQNATPSHSPKPVQQTPNKPPTPVEPSRTPIPRTRKKIMVKGKGCIISIPHDIPRGTHGYPPKPMSPAAVEAKMQNLQRLGYSTSGFGHWNGVGVGDQQAHNRAIWPTEDDVREERVTSNSNYKVFVPKKSQWDNYVNSLMEAKLAALGVSLGGEDEAPPPMSRQVSGQYPGLPFSPPLPTPSGGSHRGRQGSVVTGPFPFGPSPGHMSRQSIASPAAFANARPSMHMHRHSTFGPGSFSHHGMSPSVSGTWSPGGYFGSQDGRGGSPALPALPPSRPDLAGIISPHSPFGRRASQQFPHSPLAQDDLMVQMQMQQQQLQAQMMQQQQQQLMGLRPSSTLAEVPEDESEEEALPPLKNVAKPAPEIAHPTPRNHRHNLSENMEREAADAEYHLEEAIDKQFAEGGDFNTEPEITGQRNVTNSTWENSRPVLHQPQPHNRAHSLTKSQQQVPFAFPAQQTHNPRDDSNGARTNLSENTNPSLEDGEIRSNQHSQAASQVSNPWKDSKFAYNKPSSATHSKHASKSSLSKLNVEAKEFKFNPAASFNPASTTNSKSSIDGLSSFNVTAPAFKPDAAAFTPTAPTFKPVVDAPVFQPAGTKPVIPTDASFPSSGFNFSSPPAFKPEAPVFNPSGVSAFDAQKPVPAPTSFSSKIFGDVNISASDIIKPATRSKAVAIVRPDTARESSPETVKETEDREDEEGRPMQSEAREKRARRVRADGDEVPKFALQPVLASQPLAEPGPLFDEKADMQEEPSEDKENRSPDGRDTYRKSRSPERIEPSVEKKQPLEDSEATPVVAPRAPAEPVADPSKKHTHKTSSLSAAAKPFEFKPQHGSAGYDFGFHVTKPSRAEDFDGPQVSPPRYASRSPATTFRPSDDGSFKTALGRAYPESESVDFDPSFNDIDAVMKQMDEGGSDFGVERDDNSWDQSSPAQTPHEFDRFNLRPNVTLRSDAPSPSPRRLYANAQGSATSLLQNPFDDERAAIVSTSPVHRLNHAEDLPVSDWDDILTEGEEQVGLRSSFFDKRVDDMMARLLQNRLSPLEQTLQNVQNALMMMSSQPLSRGRRSMSTAEKDSDADDEDDDIGTDAHYRNRSPRKDRRLEKIRSVVRDALESHQAQAASMPVAAPESLGPEKIREIFADVLVSHQPPAVPVEHVSTEQIRAIVEEALVSNRPSVPEPVAEPIKPEDIKSMLAESFALYGPQPTEPIRPDDVRSIVMEAFATHAPQPASTAEPLSPEAIRSIIAETLISHQVPGPVPSIVEPMQPDTIRSIVTEALASQKSSALEAPIDIPQPQFDISEMYQVIGSLKASIAQTTSNHLQADDVRELVDDAFRRQGMEVAKRDESEAILKRDARIAELESMVEDSTLRHEAEEEARKGLEIRESDTARLLKVTEEELTLLQAAAKDDETRIRALTEERDVLRRNVNAYQTEGDDARDKLVSLEAENEELKMKNIALETSEEDLKQKLDTVSAENEALTFTLEEHRKSANKWRGDIQDAHQENEKLRTAIDQARYQVEEAARVRESMRGKFEKLQQDMVLASQQIAAERSQWQKNEQASLEKYEVLSARIEAEGRTRERLERELERLEMQEGEGMKLRIHFEQSQKHNARLEETVEQLRRESMEHQNNAARYERDMREAREAAHVEIRRTRVLMEADLDAANNQVNVVRHNLESEVSRVRAELDSVRMEAETAKEKHELELEAAADATKQAVEEALQKNKRALHEQQQAFERGFERLKQEHTRALEFSREDKHRADAFHNDKLALADSKLDHFKDKIALLEEKLVVAKEAASAAAAAAAKSPTAAGPSTLGSHEKISPQALRESISVLQEQLQERESRIEALEQKLSDADTEAPTKLKERDTEITWLRELLGVRVDDINDLINSLAQPTFDRETVRDAAIRIRTNLQMEQAEKERLISGGQNNFPTLATLSNFASPKAVQVAAAFGNWRKGRQNAASALAGSSASTSRNQTPSRPASHSAQSFLSGLMTPPTSNMRRTPDFTSSSKPKDLRSSSISSHSSVSTEQGFPGLGLGKQRAAPSTPPLLRKTSYDRDAEVERFSDNGFDDDSTVDGGDVTPIALNFGQELRNRRERE